MLLLAGNIVVDLSDDEEEAAPKWPGWGYAAPMERSEGQNLPESDRRSAEASHREASVNQAGRR